MISPSELKRAAPRRKAARDTTTHAPHDSTPRAVAESLADAKAALSDAWREVCANGVTATLREHVESAECALGIALWAIGYSLADRWPR